MTARNTRPASIREAAEAAIPNLTAIERALELTREPSPPLPAPANPEAAFTEALATARTAVLAGDPFPPTAAQPVAAAVASQSENDFRERLRARLAADLISDRDTARRNGTDAALTVLADGLEQLLADVRTLAPRLHGARTETEASLVSADAATAWATLQTLVDQYDDIRTVQLELTSRALQLNGDAYLSATTVCLWTDSIDTVAFWLKRRFDIRNAHKPSTDAAHAYVAWLNSRANIATGRDVTVPQPWWPSADTAAHLLWLADAGTAWVPTLTELRDAYTAATRAIAVITGRVPANIAEARDRYYQSTGAADLADLPREPTPEAATNLLRPVPTVTMRRRAVPLTRGLR